MSRDDGFTLVELIVTIGLMAVLMTLGSYALRHYWFVNALEQAEGEVISQLRQLQERAVSESHPLVYGARFRQGSQYSQWQLVKYNPTATPPTCAAETDVRNFATGVYVSGASFTDSSDATATCRSQISGATSDRFVFFFARGTATGGELTLRQPAINRSRTIKVTELTGRVEVR